MSRERPLRVYPMMSQGRVCCWYWHCRECGACPAKTHGLRTQAVAMDRAVRHLRNCWRVL